MNITELLQSPVLSVGLLGIIGSIAYSFKEVPIKIFKLAKKKAISRFIFKVNIPDYDTLFLIFESWLFENHSGSYKEVTATLSEHYSMPDPSTIKTLPSVRYKSAPNIFQINYCGYRLFIEKKRINIDHATDFRALFAHEYIIWGYKGKNIINKLLEEATAYFYQNIPKNSVTIKIFDKHGFIGSENTITVKPLNKVIINDELKESIIDDLNSFTNSKEWYVNNSIPYKRSFMFYGPPGTGKTSISLAIASYLSRDVYVINLNSLVDDCALQKAFSNIGPHSVLLFEDMDTSFNGRKSEGKVSFSALLNCTDGAFYKEGLITIFTTNHIEKIDPALLRPGRCDNKIEIPNPGPEQIEQFVRQFFGKDVEMPSTIKPIPMSEVQEICITNKGNFDAAVKSLLSRTMIRMNGCKIDEN